MGRSIIILVLGFIIVSGYTLSQINNTGTSGVTTSIVDYRNLVARNCATSAVNIAVSQLSNNQTLSTYNNLYISDFGGHASLDTTNLSGSTLTEIRGRGWVDGGDTVLIRTVVDLTGGELPPNVRAAITANADVNTLGTLIVDGREHNINGALIPNSGTFGISTTEIFDPGGNSMVAGTYQDTLTGSNVDLGPVKSGYDDITEENAVWDDGYPLTPDLFMGGADAGYPEGTLKQLAMDGRKGSQYATDPSDLRIPFHGITYVELADGMDWDGVDFGTSDGVLIVHNSSGTAQITNLNTGTFRGLIIADELVHIHCRVIGAVVALSPNPVTGNCIGNGTGDVLYSTKALKLANKLGTGTRGDNVAVVSWYE